jgi:hypothetical protein
MVLTARQDSVAPRIPSPAETTQKVDANAPRTTSVLPAAQID